MEPGQINVQVATLSHTDDRLARRVAIALAFFTALILAAGSAHADRVHALARTLVHSKSAKTRISAAVSLGRLKDPRALKPLVHALDDDNRVVRAVAATALGYLGNDAALPALQRATRDHDALVRKRAVEAVASIRNSGTHANRRTARRGSRRATRRTRHAGFGNMPKRIGPEPTLFIAMHSTADESHGRATKALRKRRAEQMRGFMLRELRAQADVTLSQGEAESLGLAHNSIDLSITKLDRIARGKWIEIECEIRVTISNERGKMLSFLTGGAKVQVPRATFRAKYLPELQHEAIENAVKSVHADLIVHLRRTSNPS